MSKLYNSLIKDISKIVKKRLNESLFDNDEMNTLLADDDILNDPLTKQLIYQDYDTSLEDVFLKLYNVKKPAGFKVVKYNNSNYDYDYFYFILNSYYSAYISKLNDLLHDWKFTEKNADSTIQITDEPVKKFINKMEKVTASKYNVERYAISPDGGLMLIVYRRESKNSWRVPTNYVITFTGKSVYKDDIKKDKKALNQIKENNKLQKKFKNFISQNNGLRRFNFLMKIEDNYPVMYTYYDNKQGFLSQTNAFNHCPSLYKRFEFPGAFRAYASSNNDYINVFFYDKEPKPYMIIQLSEQGKEAFDKFAGR